MQDNDTSRKNPGHAEQFPALARMLRHEVGDFLQKVYASVAILQTRLPPDAEFEREILSRLRSRAQDCKVLMDSVQDFLCPFTLKLEMVDYSPFISNLVKEWQTQNPGIEIISRISPDGLMNVDEEWVAKLLTILFTNAVESTATRIILTAGLDETKKSMECSLNDNGKGISEENLPKLFQPFFTTKSGHAGLGLALAQKIMDLHGGRIREGTSQAGVPNFRPNSQSLRIL